MFATLTCVVLYFLVLRLTQRILLAFGSALALAFSFTFWTQSVIAEVYTLNAFFLSVLILLLFKWQDARAHKWLYLFAFLCGLSFCNHMSTIFVVPATLVFVSLVEFKAFFHRIPILLSLFLLGLLPYLYLPIRSAMNPPLDWGNPETLRQFVWVVSAAQYRGSMFSGSLSEILAQLHQYRSAILNEFTILGCLVGIIGLFSMFIQIMTDTKRYLPMFMLLLLIFLADVTYTIGFRIPDGAPFYIPSYLIFALWIGMGLRFLLNALWTRSQQTLSCILLSAVLCLAIPVYALIRHYPHVDMSDLWEPQEYGESIVEVIEHNALIFTSYDGPTFALWYFQELYKDRKRFWGISMPLLPYDWYRENLKQAIPDLDIPTSDTARLTVREMIKANLKTYPVYIYFPEEPPEFLSEFILVPEGPLHRILAQDSEH